MYQECPDEREEMAYLAQFFEEPHTSEHDDTHSNVKETVEC